MFGVAVFESLLGKCGRGVLAGELLEAHLRLCVVAELDVRKGLRVNKRFDELKEQLEDSWRGDD